jgi:hypothetical protein
MGTHMEWPRPGKAGFDDFEDPAGPGAHQHDAVAEACGLVHAVRDEQDRLFRLGVQAEQIFL